MTLEQWAYIAEIVGAIVIVASLVYVAAQVRQNTKAQFAASRQATLAADLEFLSMMVDYPEDALGLGLRSCSIRFGTGEAYLGQQRHQT